MGGILREAERAGKTVANSPGRAVGATMGQGRAVLSKGERMWTRAIALFSAVALLSSATPAFAVEASTLKRVAQLRGLAARYRIIDVQDGDLDGDGTREQVVAFVSRKKGCQRGGFLILAQRAGKFRVEWAGLYEHARPESLAVQGSDIVATVATASGRKKVTLTHGKDFWFRGEKESPFAGMKIRASSQVKGAKGAQLVPANLIDGDPDTVWCTAAVGTGAGEWVEVEFAKPVDLGLVGVIGGDARGKQQWKDSNRLFRFEISAETAGDRTAMVEDHDITAMLKLSSSGKKVTAVAQDRRRTKWTEIRTREVVTVKVQASSVYLGEKNDDLYFSELDFAVLLPDPKDAPAPKPKAPPPAPAPTPAPAPAKP
jgi:hypothetical protein